MQEHKLHGIGNIIDSTRNISDAILGLISPQAIEAFEMSQKKGE